MATIDTQTRIHVFNCLFEDAAVVLAGPTTQLVWNQSLMTDAGEEISPKGKMLFNEMEPEAGAVSVELYREFREKLAELDEVISRMATAVCYGAK